MESHTERPHKKRKTTHKRVGEREMIPESNEAREMSSKKQSHLGRILETACNLFNNEENLSPLASLANLATDSKAVTELITLDIGKQLVDLIIHKNLKIQEMAAGMFRNLSTTGGTEACLCLVKDGFLDKIGIALREDLQLLRSLEHDNNKTVVSAINQLLALLCNLCEASVEAVKLFNEVKLMQTLISLFLMDRAELSLTLPVAKCFAIITEENEEAIDYLVSSRDCQGRMEDALMDIKETSQHLLLAATVSGVLVNMRGKLQEDRWKHLTDHVLNTIDWAMQIDCQPMLKGVSSSTFNDAMVEDCLSLLSAKQTCLELLANLSCFNDNESEMGISDDDLDGMEVDEDKTETDTSSSNSRVELFVSSKALTEKVFSCTQYADVPDMILLQEKAETNCLYEAILRIQRSAYFCLGNMIDNSPFADGTLVESIWKDLSEKLCARTAVFAPSESDLLLGMTNCLRAVAVLIADGKCHNFLMDENNLVKMIESWYYSTKDLQIRCNLLKVFGAIGKIFSKKEDEKIFLEQIANVLCRELVMDSPLMIVVEALDATFDAFGEDGLPDRVLSSSGLDKHLCSVAAWMNKKIKNDRHVAREDMKIARDAKVNLDRFIDYKKYTC